jgi:hypothetical protein
MYWACSTQGKEENAYKILVGKPEGKRPSGRSCEDDDKLNLKKTA